MKNLLTAAIFITALAKSMDIFNYTASAAVLVALGILFWCLPVRAPEIPHLDKMLAVLSVALFFQTSWGRFYKYTMFNEAAMCVVAVGALVVFIKGRHFWLLSCGWVLVCAMPILFGSTPWIDTYLFQKAACVGVFRGMNPYHMTFVRNFIPGILPVLDYYPYLPGTLYYFAAFDWLIGDPRWGVIFAAFVSSTIVFRQNRWIGIAFLFVPRFQWQVEFCATEAPIMLSIILGTMSRGWVRALCWGLALGMKQYVVIGFLALWRGWRSLVLPCIVALVLAAPFMIWNFKDFWADVALFHLQFKFPYISYSLHSIIRGAYPEFSHPAWFMIPGAAGALWVFFRRSGLPSIGMGLLVWFFFSNHLQQNYVIFAVWLLYLSVVQIPKFRGHRA